MLRKLFWAAALVGLVVAGKAGYDTLRDPVVKRASITSNALAVGSDPITIALLADIHVAGPDMPPSRLARIVEQVNALRPDLVAIAGDLVSEKRTATHIYTPEEVVAPLEGLVSPLGTVVVPGNHDHWFNWPEMLVELQAIDNITVLANDAAQIGPLAIGGMDDAFTNRDDPEAVFAALQPLSGPRIILTHSPDVFPQVPVNVGLVLAGHTHCGQIGYPWGGSPATMSAYGDLYACGIIKENGKTLITSAGIGTSLIPMRIFTQPEIWLITIRPPQPEG